jgi:hypothetical protein
LRACQILQVSVLGKKTPCHHAVCPDRHLLDPEVAPGKNYDKSKGLEIRFQYLVVVGVCTQIIQVWNFIIITRCDFVASGLGMQKTLQYFYAWQKVTFFSKKSRFSAFGWRFLLNVVTKSTIFRVFNIFLALFAHCCKKELLSRFCQNMLSISALVADGGKVTAAQCDKIFWQKNLTYL